MPRFRYSEKHGDLIGAHLSTKGGLHTVFDRVAEVNASAVAIFAKNSNQWKGKDLTDNDCALFAQKRTIKPVFTHASYLINLATTNPEFHRKSIAAMIDELDRAERLGIRAVVLHPGAHMGAGPDAGIDQIARSLDQIHAALRITKWSPSSRHQPDKARASAAHSKSSAKSYKRWTSENAWGFVSTHVTSSPPVTIFERLLGTSAPSNVSNSTSASGGSGYFI